MPMSPDDYELMLQRQRMGAFAPPEPTAGAFAPLSDSGPIPGQEWPQTYDPQGAARFGEVAVDALKEVAGMVPGVGTVMREGAPQGPSAGAFSPISDSGPIPGQEWPDTYDPQGAERFGELMLDAGTDAALMTALPAGASMIPRFIGKKGAAAIGAGLGIGGTASAGAVPSEEVKELQRKMAATGFYKGKIDGEMGILTREAADAYNADLRAKASTAAENAKAAATLATASANAEEAKAKRAETERLQKAADEAAKNRAAGEARLRDIDKNTSAGRKAFRDYAPLVGYGVGAALGLGSRYGLNKTSNYLSGRAADKADKLMGGRSRDTADQVSKVNDFWRLGGANEPPFLPNPGQRPAFQSNPKATRTEELFKPVPNFEGNTKADAMVAGAFGTEAGLTHFGLTNPAKAERDEAQAAVERDPSEANIARLQAAKDSVSGSEFLGNMGRGAAGMHLLTGPKFPRKPSRPDVSKAERARMNLDEKLVAQARPAKDGGKLTDSQVVDDLKALPAPKRKFEPGVRPETPAHGTAVQMAKDPNWQEAAAKFASSTGKNRINGPDLQAIAERANIPLSKDAASTLARRLNTSPDFMRNLERLKKDLSSERSARDGAAAKAALRKE